MGEKCCCCHVVTAAAIGGVLQLVLLFTTMASSGLILDRYRMWDAYEPMATPDPASIVTQAVVVAVNGTAAVTSIPDYEAERWSEAFVELSLAWYLGFTATWFLSLLILALAFKYYRPVFVVPNLVVLIIAIIFTLTIFGAYLGRLLDVDADYQVDEYEEVILAYAVGYTMFGFLVELIAFIMVMMFHGFLKEANGPMGGR